MGYLGLEPRTYRLKAEYSTIELVTLFKNRNNNLFIFNYISMLFFFQHFYLDFFNFVYKTNKLFIKLFTAMSNIAVKSEIYLNGT